MEEEPEYKVIFLGNSGVGKTQLINSILGKDFDSDSLSTTNATFLSKYIKIKKKNYKINLWDTAGQEIYRAITSLFIKGSAIVVFVYDITDQTSYDDLEFWIEKAQEILENNCIYAIVGNKIDLFYQQKIQEVIAKNLAESKGFFFRQLTAKSDPKGVNDFIEMLLEKYIGQFGEKKGEINIKIEKKSSKSRYCCSKSRSSN